MNDLKVSISERQFGRVQGGPINFSRTEFCRAQLDQATLIEANLVGTMLTGADLSDARLERADLRGAKLAHATLSGARLEGANLCGADLRLARGLTQRQIDQALGDRRTALPADLMMPRTWLREDELGQPITRAGQPGLGDESADPYAVLGISPGAPIQDIRVAWLKLVKDLHPDRSSGEAEAAERLKAINQAYQRVKNLERQATQGPGARGFFGTSKAVLATFFIVTLAVGTLVVGIETYLARADVAPGQVPPVAYTTVKTGEPQAPPSISPARSRKPLSTETWK